MAYKVKKATRCQGDEGRKVRHALRVSEVQCMGQGRKDFVSAYNNTGARSRGDQGRKVKVDTKPRCLDDGALAFLVSWIS